MEIILEEGRAYRTSDASLYGKVISGSILVYIQPYKDDIPQRKQYLNTLCEGDCVPFLDFYMDEKHWGFQLRALEKSKIEIICSEEDLPKVRKDFAKKSNVFLFEADMFQEEMAETYNMGMVKAEAYVYASASERISSYENCKNLIDDSCGNKDKSGFKSGLKSPAKNEVLGRAIDFLCRHEGYKNLPPEKWKDKSLRNMDAFQIASLIGIPARKIYLEPGWMKKDFGSFIGRKADDGSYVVFFKKLSGYYIYDPLDEKVSRVNPSDEDRYEKSGIMFYYSFDKQKMDLKSLISFGIRKTSLKDWIIVFLFTVIGAFAVLMLPSFYGYLTDVLLNVGNIRVIAEFGTMLLSCMTGYFFIMVVKNLTIYRSVNKMQNIVMPALYDRLLHLPEEVVKHYDAADLGQRAVKISKIFRDAVRSMTSAASSIIYSFIFGIFMIAYDLKMGLCVIACAVVFLILAFFLCRGHIKLEKDKQIEEGKMNALMFQYLSGIQKVRTDGMEDRALYEYLKKYTKMCGTELAQGRGQAWLDTFSKVYSGITMLLIFMLYLPWMADGNIGSFVGLFMVSELFVQNVTDAVLSFWQADFMFPAYDRCKPILEHPAEREEGSGSVGKLEGRVEVNNVSFSYEKGETKVLNHISLQAEPGEYVGIVGSTGCGKSTLFQIMLGFEKPDKGGVFYDHKDLERLNKTDLRKKIGVVLQEESLFTGSIFENISVAAEKMTQEEAWKLLDEVQLREDVEEMPMGLHTLVTESGNTISGGQKQRILLARALAGHPSVLFLDEATSALDNETQDKVIKMLDKKRMTRIVIAHRINTVKKCNRIFVMDKGQIVESGNYEELLRQKGIFYKLAKRQLVSM